MKITMNDMDHPSYWKIKASAETIVHDALGSRFIETMSDREAKATADAIEALTKAKLLVARRERVEIS